MIAEFCTGNSRCKCGATGCPVACGYTVVHRRSSSECIETVVEKKKKPYSKFISSRINKKGNRKTV